MSASLAYRAYLLRLWRTADSGWRAALVDPHTGEQLAFATLEHCWGYLLRLELCDNAAGAAASLASMEKTDLD